MKSEFSVNDNLMLVPETKDEALRLLATLVADVCELNCDRRTDPRPWQRLLDEARAIGKAIRAGLSGRPHWRVIGVEGGWCVHDGQGMPNSKHPRTTDYELAERLAKLLNTEP